MSIIATTARRSAGAAVVAPASPSSVSLAELLAEVGTAIETSPVPAPSLAVITAHLLDAAHEAGAPAALFVPNRDSSATLSLRALGRLAVRTAGLALTVPAPTATRIRTLLTAANPL